jgi:hypothetical protein
MHFTISQFKPCLVDSSNQYFGIRIIGADCDRCARGMVPWSSMTNRKLYPRNNSDVASTTRGVNGPLRHTSDVSYLMQFR